MAPTQAPAQATHPGNNFDAIRILAAAMVLFSHHFALTGNAEPSFFGVHSVGGLAVTIFFIISGYLVTISWWRDPHVWRFALRRFLRIWPALTAVVVVTTYGLGTWVTKLPLQEYLLHPGTAEYLQALWMRIHFVLPGVFENNPYPHGVNGSLWTIPYEVRCYIVLCVAGLLGLLKYRPVLLLCIAGYMAWFFHGSNADLSGIVHYGRELSAFFLAGAGLAALEPWWRRRPMLWAIVIAAAFALAWSADWRHTALLIGLPFLVIYTGTRATPIIHRAGRWGDPSYGIYLFAFPVQQTVILYAWPDAGFVGTFILALLITLVLSYASWHLLEKQALKFKPSSPLTTRRGDSPSQQPNSRWPSLAKRLWPLLPCSVGLRFISERLDAPILPDPEYTYLPAARAFLDQGWSFFLTPQSYQVTPLAYLWPALWGTDTTLIRIANMGLWIGCVWFLWRACYLLGGLRAGAVAMLLLLSPELVRYFPSEMTEPLYLFGIFGWMHAMARIVIGNDHAPSVIAQGSLMLAITLLSRPVLQLIAPAALLACLCCITYWSMTGKDIQTATWHQRTSTIAWSLGLGLILPLTLLIKNGSVFGLWALGTGSGTGLYLGTHPLFQGAEPGFLGFSYDINAMVSLAGHPGSHLSIGADRAASAAALWQLQQMSMVDGAGFFIRKLWWWLAHHPAQIEAFGSSLRKLRFFELLVLVTTTAWLTYGWLRRGGTRARSATVATWQLAFAAFLLVMFLAMLAQLMPILHNSRYSSVLLDPWLIPLTAFGISHLTATINWQGMLQRDRWSIGLRAREGTSLWPPLAALTLIVLATFNGYSTLKKYETIAIDPKHMGETVTLLEISDNSSVEIYGMAPKSDHAWVTTDSPAVLHVRITSNDIQHVTSVDPFNALWETSIRLQSGGRPCRRAEVAYQTADGRILQPPQRLPLLLPLETDGQIHSLVTHANHELRPREPGSLRIVLDCPIGTSLDWHGTRLLESHHAWDAASHIQH